MTRHLFLFRTKIVQDTWILRGSIKHASGGVPVGEGRKCLMPKPL